MRNVCANAQAIFVQKLILSPEQEQVQIDPIVANWTDLEESLALLKIWDELDDQEWK